MKLLFKLIVGSLALFAVMQIIPYGKNHTNPPVQREPAWNNPVTRDLAKKACFDCHSNETVWPWYSKIAPVSWLVYWDVVEGREHLNFSEWSGGTRKGETLNEITKELAEGEMPPLQYTVAHPEAKLDDKAKKILMDGLSATVSASPR